MCLDTQRKEKDLSRVCIICHSKSCYYRKGENDLNRSKFLRCKYVYSRKVNLNLDCGNEHTF